MEDKNKMQSHQLLVNAVDAIYEARKIINSDGESYPCYSRMKYLIEFLYQFVESGRDKIYWDCLYDDEWTIGNEICDIGRILDFKSKEIVEGPNGAPEFRDDLA